MRIILVAIAVASAALWGLEVVPIWAAAPLGVIALLGLAYRPPAVVDKTEELRVKDIEEDDQESKQEYEEQLKENEEILDNHTPPSVRDVRAHLERIRTGD